MKKRSGPASPTLLGMKSPELACWSMESWSAGGALVGAGATAADDEVIGFVVFVCVGPRGGSGLGGVLGVTVTSVVIMTSLVFSTTVTVGCGAGVTGFSGVVTGALVVLGGDTGEGATGVLAVRVGVGVTFGESVGFGSSLPLFEQSMTRPNNTESHSPSSAREGAAAPNRRVAATGSTSTVPRSLASRFKGNAPTAKTVTGSPEVYPLARLILCSRQASLCRRQAVV